MIRHIILGIVLTIAFVAPVYSQTDEDLRQFEEAYSRAERQAVQEFPDSTMANSPLVERMIKIDRVAKLIGDPLFHSPNKPVYLARRAGAELGIPFGQSSFDPESGGFRVSMAKPIPDFNGFKSVEIVKIYADGISIRHKDGASKISFENLSQETKDYYGLTEQGAAANRKKIAQLAAEKKQRAHAVEEPRERYPQPQQAQQPAFDPALEAGAKQQAFNDWVAQGGGIRESGLYAGKFRHEYRSGPMKGMTQEEAVAKFHQMWAATPDNVKQQYRVRAAENMGYPVYGQQPTGDATADIKRKMEQMEIEMEMQQAEAERRRREFELQQQELEQRQRDIERQQRELEYSR